MSEPIERVVVALDLGAAADELIDLAVRIARRAGAPLKAVFVEDDELKTLAHLAVAREVVAGAGTGRLTAAEIELHSRIAAERAHAATIAAAREQTIDYSFEIVQGGAEAVLASVSERDLVIAAALARPVAGHLRVTSSWLRVLGRHSAPILLTRQPATNRDVAVVLRRRNDAAARLLRAAARIADARQATLILLCPPALIAERDFREWAEAQIAPFAVRAAIEPAAPAEGALLARIAELGCGLVAVAAAEAGDSGELRRFGDRLDCDLLIL
jgi:hypothetical protein